jgi:tetratricopeptide (TPR) repeat protein
MKGQVAMAQNQPSKAVIEFEKLTRNYKAPLAYYNLALACQAMNDFPKAIANLNQALAMNPAFTDAALALAQIKMNSGDFISAVSSLNQLIHQQPKLSSAHILLARAYEGQGKLDEAEKVYRRLEDSYPTNGQVPLLYGNLLAAQHRRADARQEYSKALELGPDYLFALEKIVDLDLEEQHYPAALDRLQKFGEKRPNTPGLSLVVAKVYLAQGDLKQAVSVLDQAINAHPDRVTAYLMLASAYGDAKDYTHALESIRKLLAKYPDNPQGQMMLATLLGDSKDSKAAEQAYEKALVQNPQNGVALNNLACLYLNDGELDKAYESAHKARDLMPREPSTADTLGWICYKRGDYEQAAPLVDESAATLSTMPEVQLHVGMAHYMLGDEDRARLSLQFAAQSKTDFPGKEMAGRSLAILDINPKTASSDARSMLEKRVAEQPADSVALRRLAAIYARDGSLDKAISNYESALKHSPKNTRVMVELARIYSAQPAGQAKALDLAKSAYKLAPNDPEVSHLFGRLAYDTGDDKLSYDLLKESARKRPGNPELQFDLAEAAYSEGRVDEAQSAMRNALQDATFSRAADAKHFLEIVPLAENASAAMAASAQIDQALKADPEYVPALMASGIISEAKNDPAAAKQAYEKALQRHPDFVRAKRRIAILSAQQPGDDKRAYDYATQAQQAFPDDPELTKVLGIITYRQGDYNRSANYLKASAAKKTDDAQLMYWLGMAQFKLHNKADSKKNLLQAIDLKLPDNMAGEAKKTLAQLN